MWTLVALLVAGSLWIELARHRATAAERPDDVVADLLAPIGNGWADEAVRREVTRPAPVLVRWSSTGRPAAGRPAVLGDPRAGDWREFPLSGETDALNTGIVAAFRALPRRQLVVLGEPGAGKSVFALLLTLGLIRTHADGEPLPVLVPVSGWDPAVPLDDFLARRLAEDQRAALSRHGDPAAVARRLIAQNRVLPLLDGLDELPTASIGRAMRVLDDYASAGRPLVVTCRSREYERARHILTTAAVVELEPVGVDAAVAYLSYPEPARPRWEPVFARLRGAGGDDPLARTLSTPLMVSLARAAYRDPGTDPGELLSLGTRSEVAGRLMDAFVAAAYPGARERRWLSCLAYHLYTAGTRDLHWRRFDPGLLAARPERARTLVVVVAVLAAGLAGGVLGAVAGVTARWSTVAAALVMLAAALGWLSVIWPAGYPGPVVRRGRRPVLFGYGLAVGVLTGFITLHWASALPAGLLCGLLFTTPFLRHGAVQALTVAVVFSSAEVLAGGVPSLAVGMTAFLLCASTAVLCSGGWLRLRFRLTAARLSLRGWLPWRYERFLRDAGRRGLLRRAGALHQFRHALLQDHLARPVRLRDLRARAAAGDDCAGRLLADLLAGSGDVGGAIDLLSRISGDAIAAGRLAALLARAGRADELLDRARGGDRQAARRLAEVLAEQGDLGRLRSRANAGDRYAAARLAALLVERGDIGALENRAAGGDRAAARALADHYAATDRIDDAITVLAAMADDRHSRLRLAGILDERGEFHEAIALLQPQADAGDGRAAAELADLLARRGRISQLRARADTGDGFAGERLAEVLFEAGSLTELRARADAGDRHAPARLADLLFAENRVSELLERWDRGEHAAAPRVADVFVASGRPDLAVAALREWADLPDGTAARRLAELLTERGDLEEAISVLRRRVDRGDAAATLRLADLLADQGDVEEAILVLRPRAEDGDQDAVARLARFAEAGQP